METTHKIKLVYYNSRGLAEIARLLLAAAHVQYEDVRFSSDPEKARQEHEELKKTGKLTYEQVPMLEFDGQIIVQSAAIYRFLARKFGFYGANAVEAAHIDVVIEGFIDLQTKFTAFRALPEDKKAEAKILFGNETLPLWLSYMEKILKKNQSNSGYFVGNKLSIADVFAFHYLDVLKREFPNCLDNSPLLAALLERVSREPGISEWLEKRP